MAEERDVALARAATDAGDDEDRTKAELQRRMEEARESITQTVTEIKDTVTNQYQAVRQSVTEALDWREQYRKRPIAWSVGAASVGFIVGYSVCGAIIGDGEDRSYYTEYEDDYATSGEASTAARYPAAAERSSAPAATPYAPQPSAAYAASYGQSAASQSAGGYTASSVGEAQADEPDKPGLLERFKETKAYDRLQDEVASLGDRLLDEVSNVGQTVVLPLIFNKIKDLFGLDLSNKQQAQGSSSSGAGTGVGTSGASGASTDSASASRSAAASGGGGSSSASGSGGSTYGTSENSPIGSSR